MAKIKLTYKRIRHYLKDLLSDRQRHDLEKEVMRDAFEEKAFEGLSQLTAAELEEDMNKLQTRLAERTGQHKKPVFFPYFRLAASILLLLGIGTGLYLLLHKGGNTIPPDRIAKEPKELKEIQADSINDSIQQEKIIPEEEIPETAMEKEYVAELVQKIDKQTVIEKEHSNEIVQQHEQKNEIELMNVRKEVPIDNKNLETLTMEKLQDELTVIPPQTAKQVLKGRVLDEEGNPLPGVNIIEKGTTNGVISDRDGEFVLELTDSRSEITLSFIGYQTQNLLADNIANANIIMQEDLLALEEVVVVGYGTVKKSDLTGAISVIEADSTGIISQVKTEYLGPVPPDGSLKAYKDCIYSQLDYNKFQPDSVKYRIKVTFTVNTNGSLSNIKIHDDIPQTIKDELKRVLYGSPAWKPAEENGVPVKEKVVIRLRIDREEK